MHIVAALLAAVWVGRSLADLTPTPSCTAINPVPTIPNSGGQKYVCNARGHISPKAPHPDRISFNQRVDNMDDCISLALRHRHREILIRRKLGFVTFGFSETRKVCRLLIKSPHHLRFVPDEKSDMIFWSTAHCFDCPSPCPLPENTLGDISAGRGINLLDDGGFQDSAQDLGPWEQFHYDYAPEQPAVPPGVVSPGVNSSRAYNCTSDQHCSLLQTYLACTDQTYLLSFDYKAVIKEGNSSGYFDVEADEIDYFQEGPPIGTLTSIQMSYRRLKKHRSLLSFVEFDSNTGFAVDNVGLYAISDPVPATDAPELVVNGGFEAGKDISPWVLRSLYSSDLNYSHVASPGISSAHGFEIFLTTKRNFEDVDLSQNISTVKGARYLFGFDYMAINASIRRIDIVIGNYQWLFNNFAVGRTVRYERIFTAYMDIMKIDLSLEAKLTTNRNATEGYLLLDNVSVKPV